MTPRAVFPKWGSPERPSARIRYRVTDSESRLVGRELHAVHELDSRPRVLGKQQVPVQVDVVAERSHLRRSRDGEPRLDHAPEHDAESERARGVRHLDRLADPARLRELDVDAVRALSAD